MNPRTWFSDHGVGLFPLQNGRRGKEPACTSWDDYTGPVHSRNYGVRLGRADRDVLVVVDPDDSTATEWVDRHLPRTPFVVTTGRGSHRYYRMPDLPPVRFLHRDGHTIELKGHGQYVVGPESIHPSGAVYTATEWSWRWDDIPYFPADVVFDDRPEGCATRSEKFEFPNAVHSGERHHQLFRLLRSLKALGLERPDARVVVHYANVERCQPPVNEDRVFEMWFERAWRLPDRPLASLPFAIPDVDESGPVIDLDAVDLEGF